MEIIDDQLSYSEKARVSNYSSRVVSSHVVTKVLHSAHTTLSYFVKMRNERMVSIHLKNTPRRRLHTQARETCQRREIE